MTIKQRLAEMLPHFDDNGNILPNKIVMGRIVGQELWHESSCKTIGSIVHQMQSGNEYRIEDAPKRTREVWVHYENCGIPVCCSAKYSQAIRFIEDVPREVTHEDGVRALAFYADKVGRGGRVEAMQATLQHYENERGK